MTFKYNKINAKCMWCKRTQNPHPDFLKETIPTKIFESKKGRMVELCFSCFEQEKAFAEKQKIDFKIILDTRKAVSYTHLTLPTIYSV